MEPRIRYAQTSDGVNIAWYALGQGPYLVVASALFATHLSEQWKVAPRRRTIETLARHFTVVRYDGRGSGLSDREPRDYSLEGRVRDIEAVVRDAGADRFHLFSGGHGGLAAVAYASRYPEQVDRLVLVDPYAKGDDLYRDSPRMRFVAGLASVTVEEQWEYTSLALATRSTSPAEAPYIPQLAALIRASMGPQELLEFREATRKLDITSLLPQVQAPTLIIHADADQTPLSYARTFVSSIPDAHLVTVTPNRGSAFMSEVLEATMKFLGVEAAEFRPEQDAPASGMTAILFADIADSTALTERLGDKAFREKARELDGALRAVIRENGGTPVEGKLLGDGVLAVFTSARQAIEAALRCAQAGSHGGLPLHLGIHAGDVIREEGNVYGGAVNIASRISALSAPGEVLVSETVRSLARTSVGVRFEDRGEQSLKGVGEPVRVWAVREGGR